MILCFDIGNTNITIGAYSHDTPLFIARIATDLHKMQDEYAVLLRSIISVNGLVIGDITGAIISSVVPGVTGNIREAIKKLNDVTVLTVGPGIKTGLDIKIDDPSTLGGDLVCVAVAALEKYKVKPAVVVDLGTATKIVAIDRSGSLIGGSFLPGMKIAMDALSTRTALLPHVGLETPSRLIGSNTIDSMRSGIMYGTASMVDGMIVKYKRELGDDLTAIMTGGLSKEIAPLCEEQLIYDDNLIMDGLRALYQKNTQS